MKMAEIEVAPYLHGRGFSDPKHVGIIYIKLYPLTIKTERNIVISVAAINQILNKIIRLQLIRYSIR